MFGRISPEPPRCDNQKIWFFGLHRVKPTPDATRESAGHVSINAIHLNDVRCAVIQMQQCQNLRNLEYKHVRTANNIFAKGRPDKGFVSGPLIVECGSCRYLAADKRKKRCCEQKTHHYRLSGDAAMPPFKTKCVANSTGQILKNPLDTQGGKRQ